MRSCPQFWIALSPVFVWACVAAAAVGGPTPAGSDPVTWSIEGFGSATRGAQSSPDGFTEFHVSSLEDAGPGTLREALRQGKRRIVFDVAGTITLQSSLYVHA